MNRFTLLPPRPGCCQVCAVPHDPREPHNAQSVYYGVWFVLHYDASPTWADAMAHCDPDLRVAWAALLRERGAVIGAVHPEHARHQTAIRNLLTVLRTLGTLQIPQRHS